MTFLKSTLVFIIIALTTFVSGITPNEQKFIGFWEGTLRIRENEIEVHLDFYEEEMQLQGKISIPIQRMHEHPLNSISVDFPEIYFELESGVIAKFYGRIDNGHIRGNFSQPGGSGLFYVSRSERKETFFEDITYDFPEESEVQLSTRFGNLYGSLLIPDKKKPMPIVLIIAGSGPTDRDGNNPMFGNGQIYKNLALEFYHAGIASLRFDKRGIGASASALAREEDIRFNFYIQDAIDWIKKLNQMNEFSKVIVFGHSEGALVGMLALQNESTDAFISAAGPGRNMADILEDQISRQPEPYSSEGIEIINSLRKGIIHQNVSDELKPVFRVEIQPYILSQFQYNPAEAIAKLEMPILIIQGTTDIQIPVTDAEFLAKANPKAYLSIIGNMNHVFRTSSKDLQETFLTYGNPNIPFSQGFISEIVDFINQLK